MRESLLLHSHPMGSAQGQSHHTGHMDPLRSQSAYLSPIAESSLPSLPSIPPTDSIQPCPNNIRQHDDCLLRKQTRWRKIPPSVCRGHQLMELVCQELHNGLGDIPTGAQNSLEDNLSRHVSTDREWDLHDCGLNERVTQWIILSWDLWASQTNKEFILYRSRAALGKGCKSNTLLPPEMHLSSPLATTTGTERDLSRQSSSHSRCTQWTPDSFLLQMAAHRPISIHPFPNLLTQGNGTARRPATQTPSTLRPGIWMGLRPRMFMFGRHPISS